MSQDSDGIAEVMRGGAQLGFTLGAQGVETIARMRERSRVADATEATRAAEDAQRRLAGERAVALVAAGARSERADRAVADVGSYDSRVRRERLQEHLTASVGEQAALARVVADTGQARPAQALTSRAVDLQPGARRASPAPHPGLER